MRLKNSLSNSFHLKKLPWLCFFFMFGLFFASTATADLRTDSPVVKAVQKVSNAVVNISTEYEVKTTSNPFSRFNQDSLFNYFFKDFNEPGFRQNAKRTSLGSGVIIDGTRGFVLTNTHVIAESGTIHVILKDNRQFDAKIVGADSDSDLAVLKIFSREKLPSIEMGISDDLLIGETVIAIGNPFGFSNTVTTGVVSALNRTVQTEDKTYRDFIQTDASINPGNSGGPLLNINGDLIGINTAVYANAQGIGFAIPISKAIRIVNDLIKYGEVIHAWIGLSLQAMDSQLSAYLNTDQKQGVLINKVYSGSPAAKAGLRPGDILVSIDKTTLSNPADYRAALKDASLGQNLTLVCRRNNSSLKVSVTPSAFPMDSALELAQDLYGIQVSDISKNIQSRRQSRFSGGIAITSVASTSELSRIGVAPGDVIHAIDDTTVSNMEDFKKAVVKYRLKNTVVVLIERNGRLYNVTVKLS